MKIIATILSFVFACGHTYTLHAQATPTAADGRVMIELGDVTDSEVGAVKAALSTFAADGDIKEVYLRINSNGGSISAGLDLIQAFDHYPKKLICVADTHAYSMGLSVLEGCPHRLMTTRATLMMHQCKIQGAGGSETELEDAARACHAMTEAMIHLAAEHMKISDADIRARMVGKEWWFDSVEALDVGAVDAIVDPATLPILTPIQVPESLSDFLRGR